MPVWTKAYASDIIRQKAYASDIIRQKAYASDIAGLVALEGLLGLSFPFHPFGPLYLYGYKACTQC